MQLEVTRHLQGWHEVLQLLIHDVANRHSQMCWIKCKVRERGLVAVAILDIVLVVAVLFRAHHEHHLHQVLGGLGKDVWRSMQKRDRTEPIDQLFARTCDLQAILC